MVFDCHINMHTFLLLKNAGTIWITVSREKKNEIIPYTMPSRQISGFRRIVAHIKYKYQPDDDE